MKYAWKATQWEDGNEIMEFTLGQEMMDVGDVPFDPPQFYEADVPFDPPQYIQVPTDGDVIGLNREGQDGEETGNITPQHLTKGMDNELYLVVDKAFTVKDQADIDIIIAAREDEQNARLARLEAIAAAQTSEGGSQYTVDELDTWLDNQYDVTNYDALGLAIHQLDDADMSPAARAALVAMFQEIKQVFGKSKAVDRKIGIEILK
jgi:hypothetical protein